MQAEPTASIQDGSSNGIPDEQTNSNHASEHPHTRPHSIEFGCQTENDRSTQRYESSREEAVQDAEYDEARGIADGDPAECEDGGYQNERNVSINGSHVPVGKVRRDQPSRDGARVRDCQDIGREADRCVASLNGIELDVAIGDVYSHVAEKRA